MKTVLVTLAKGEDSYLDEFLEYYLLLGFDDIFIFQNNWRFKNADAYKNNAKVHFVEMDGEAIQRFAYNRFLEQHWNEYDFAAFFDVDEFLLLKKHLDIKNFLENYWDVPAIGINMRIFGDSFLAYDGKNHSCIRRFVYSDSKLNSLLKCILNLRMCKDKVRISNPHMPNVPCVDPNKVKVTRNGNFFDNRENEIAELAHYRNKTYDECYKRKFKNTDVMYGYLERVNDPQSGRTNLEVFNKEFETANRNEMLNLSVFEFYNKLKEKNQNEKQCV